MATYYTCDGCGNKIFPNDERVQAKVALQNGMKTVSITEADLCKSCFAHLCDVVNVDTWPRNIEQLLKGA